MKLRSLMDLINIFFKISSYKEEEIKANIIITTEKISAVSNVINANNRTFSFYVKPTKHIKMMKPNLLAMITAHDYEANDAISVPTKLIRIANGEHFIYTIKTNGKKKIWCNGKSM